MSQQVSNPLDPDAGFTATPSISQAANDLRLAAGEKAREIMHTAEVRASQFRQIAADKAAAIKNKAMVQAGHLRESATEQWEHTRVKAKEMHSTAEDYIREHPTKCVLAALGIGFLAGLIMRR